QRQRRRAGAVQPRIRARQLRGHHRTLRVAGMTDHPSRATCSANGGDVTDNFTTNTAGIPVESDDHSLTVGGDGPILLQDAYLIEKIAAFNRERVPERQPHAKGAGAFGRFEVTHDVRAYTKADLFQPRRTTEVLARFST